MVGYAFMGAAHSQGWRTAGHVFDLPMEPALAAVCGRDRAAVDAAAARLGWAAAETDWRALIARDDVQLVDICTPGDSHAEIAIAALEAGKHVLCEKPLANTVAEAEAMAEAAERAAARGQVAMVGFNYRRVPAITYARQLIAQGRLGTLRHVRAAYLQDWLVDPESPLTWRLERERAYRGRSATWARTSSTWPSIWRGSRWSGCRRSARPSYANGRGWRARRPGCPERRTPVREGR